MTEEQQVVAAIKAEIAKLPDDDRYMCLAIAMTLTNIVNGERRDIARLAFGLVGAQMAAAA